jgi:hypothetical protein
MKMTARLYGQFLLSSQINYTCTYLADHLADLTHDNVQYFLKTSRFSPRQIWQSLKGVIQLSCRGYLIFDDTVLSKEHSHRIDLVRRQYSGNAQGIIKGIGVVNCIYYNPDLEQFWLIDYRIFSPQTDGKTKLDHLQDMLESAKNRQIPFQTLLMDTWYATNEIFKYLLTEHKLFYCPIKANRKIDHTQGQQSYKQVQEAYWSDTDVKEGKTIKLYKMPLATYFKLFRVLVTPTRTDYIITNDITQCDTQAAEQESSIRWTIEQFHREAKQLTGIQNCQCRMARSQRNHIAMASLVWINLKQLAYTTQKTVYQLKQSLLDHYLSALLINPSITFA